ncbi:FMN-dependent dehydrogenase-domain-containing protein [Aspergillus cavernicola]|uniref:FMN-dependent dehydrogenase-domain-containing protein n=1 Tax=Aspergillus cavernicola TaxID=176166 RepID=A0ABR4IDF3_9EURO
MLTRSEVNKHTSRETCWVIINGIGYDLTTFLDAHPGGPGIILKYAGKDATSAFEKIHSGDLIARYIEPQHVLGCVTGNKEDPEPLKAITISSEPQSKKVELRSIVNIHDFENAAQHNLTPQAFAFFKSGADDEHTARWNHQSWQSIRFRPRVLRPITTLDLSTSILGTKTSLPFFICPAGGGKLAHTDGEILMTKAAANHGALHWVCNMAGCTKEEIAKTRGPDQTLFWQIYAKGTLTTTEEEIREAVQLGYKGFALTVDAVRPGKRERDLRLSLEEEDSSSSCGISAQRGAVWSSFDWISAAKWLRSLTDLPIAIKGIQCWEDAALCAQHGFHPWLSNHGGRQLEGAPSAVETLLEMRRHCPDVLEKCDVIVDGGITRGTDIVKALALGAKAVGLGRPFLYALTFGEAGVDKAIQILRQEMETAMALLGVGSIDQLGPSYLAIREREFKL